MRRSLARINLQSPPKRTFHHTPKHSLRETKNLPASSRSPEDDFYSLLLADPAPNPSATVRPARAPKASNPSASASVPPSSKVAPKPTKPPDNRILFSAPLAGPSARMRGLARGEQGLGRPPEPDNCCMSGCVNCVWDAYREEVEEWAAGRKKREAQLHHLPRDADSTRSKSRVSDRDTDGGIGDLDEPGGPAPGDLGLDHEGNLFEGIPVGILEFMKQEKRLRERKARQD